MRDNREAGRRGDARREAHFLIGGPIKKYFLGSEIKIIP
jgi:hypothetical protein